jgi:hypothetical protein
MFSMLAMLAITVAALGAGAVLAEPPHDQGSQAHPRNAHPPGQHNAPPGYQMDSRYHHDHYYPPRGYVVPQLPHAYHDVHYGNHHYYYGGGAWYGPYGPGYAVIAPPIGLTVGFLPDVYTTLWFGNVPYYYANSVYYARNFNSPGYVVVEPPAGEPTRVEATVGPTGEDFFMYPRNGQGTDQQARDRYECHSWAVQQTGFDPSQADGTAASDGASGRADYLRAISACLDARGYTVR